MDMGCMQLVCGHFSNTAWHLNIVTFPKQQVLGAIFEFKQKDM